VSESVDRSVDNDGGGNDSVGSMSIDCDNWDSPSSLAGLMGSNGSATGSGGSRPGLDSSPPRDGRTRMTRSARSESNSSLAGLLLAGGGEMGSRNRPRRSTRTVPHSPLVG
jgi:hypothetical protein